MKIAAGQINKLFAFEVCWRSWCVCECVRARGREKTWVYVARGTDGWTANERIWSSISLSDKKIQKAIIDCARFFRQHKWKLIHVGESTRSKIDAEHQERYENRKIEIMRRIFSQQQSKQQRMNSDRAKSQIVALCVCVVLWDFEYFECRAFSFGCRLMRH